MIDFNKDNFGSRQDCERWLKRNGWTRRRRGQHWYRKNAPGITLEIRKRSACTFEIVIHGGVRWVSCCTSNP